MIRPLLIAFLVASAPLANADRAAEQLVLATYKLAGEGSTATGLCVTTKDEDGTAKRYIISAAHVFEQMKGNSFKIVSRTPQGDGTYTRDEIEVPLRKGKKALWKQHETEDIAALPLPDSVEIGALPVECIATEKQIADVHVGDALRGAVFPEQSEANGAGFPLLRGGFIASFPIQPIKSHAMYLVHTTTWPGDSGGPVMHATLRSADGKPLVVGIVRGMRSITDKEKASRYVKTESSYPLDIAEVLHATLALDLLR